MGLNAPAPADLETIVDLCDGWSGGWWFTADMAGYNARTLVDLSGYGMSVAQQEFGEMVKNTVKHGGASLPALLVVTARSMLVEGLSAQSRLIWGVYPGSSSANNDTEPLSDFTHRLRTATSRVRMAKRDVPLFIRHAHAPKRSWGRGSRTDPMQEITTLHLNPAYRGKVAGRNAIVLDDCTTYGMSFGVAAAFLRRAGAESVTCIALGKFGKRFQHWDITINDDPFAPVSPTGYVFGGATHEAGTTSPTAQAVLRRLIS